VDDFYDKLLGTSEPREHTINLLELGIPTHTHTHDLADLDSPFMEEEVWLTIKQLPSDKALDPDGFTGHFYKACWSIIKNDIMVAISAVWSRKLRGLGPLNTTYITLITKKENAE
jgi:hypothetical protein